MLINTVGGIGTEQNYNQNKVHSEVKKSVIGIEVDKLREDIRGDRRNKNQTKITDALR